MYFRNDFALLEGSSEFQETRSFFFFISASERLQIKQLKFFLVCFLCFLMLEMRNKGIYLVLNSVAHLEINVPVGCPVIKILFLSGKPISGHGGPSFFRS